MKTSSCKAKGRKFQQQVAESIADVIGVRYGPDELVASREMGQSGTDIRLIGEAKEKFPFSVECKNQERWNISEWIKQAKSNQEKGTDWMLVIKKNHTKPIVIMDWERFLAWERVINGG